MKHLPHLTLAIQAAVDFSDTEKLIALAKESTITFKTGAKGTLRVLCNGADVTDVGNGEIEG